MRKIKFRGYRVNDTAWAYGDLVHMKGDARAIETFIQDDGVPLLVDPETPVIRPKRRTTKIVLTPEQQDWLRDHFATTLNKDVEAHARERGITIILLHEGNVTN